MRWVQIEIRTHTTPPRLAVPTTPGQPQKSTRGSSAEAEDLGRAGAEILQRVLRMGFLVPASRNLRAPQLVAHRAWTAGSMCGALDAPPSVFGGDLREYSLR